MTGIHVEAVHHFSLTVTDKEQALEFYTNVLDFELAVDYGTKYILSNGSILMSVGTAPDESRASADDRFDENRVGLDHLSFSVASLSELEAAIERFDERGISHGEIKDLGDFGIYVLAFRDPDNIQLELTALKE
jgi:catechol 2,3-dioxygenase-like lactoylglutathione lyase family enzyme